MRVSLYIIGDNDEPYLVTNSAKDFHLIVSGNSLQITKVDRPPTNIYVCESELEAKRLHSRVYELMSEKRLLMIQRRAVKKIKGCSSIVEDIEYRLKREYFEFHLKDL